MITTKKPDRFAGIVSQYALWASIDPDYSRIHEGLKCMLVDELGSAFDPAIDVLEIGCGTGHTSRIILEADHRVRLTMIEMSSEMVASAKKNLKSYENRYHIHLGDMIDILPRLNQFPVIISAQTIHNLCPTEQEKAYQLIFETLVNGGLFLSGDKVSLNSENEYRRTLAAVQERIELLRSEYPDACNFFLQHESEDDRIRMTEGEIIEMLRRAGFSEVNISGRAGMHAIISARK